MKHIMMLSVRALEFEKLVYAMWMYTDPGTGLLLLQIIGSMFASALFFARRKIYSLFTRIKFHTDKASADETEQVESPSSQHERRSK